MLLVLFKIKHSFFYICYVREKYKSPQEQPKYVKVQAIAMAFLDKNVRN